MCAMMKISIFEGVDRQVDRQAHLYDCANLILGCKLESHVILECDTTCQGINMAFKFRKF